MKKIDTFKFGPFTFSETYEKEKIEKYLVEFQAFYDSIKNIPILPEVTAQLQVDLIRRSIFGTARIEGNPLSEEEVGKIISSDVVRKKLNDAQIQIDNLKKVYAFIDNYCPKEIPFVLTEEVIQTIHAIITKDTDKEDNEPGQYMGGEKYVGNKAHGGVYRPPKQIDDIKKLMKEYIEWINAVDVVSLGPLVKGGLAHYYLGLIHPFGNGNGRTARAIEALILKCAGYKYIPEMLSNYYQKNIDEYFISFSSSERDKKYDNTCFIEFVAKGLVESVKELRDKIYWAIRLLSLRDYFNFLRKSKTISQRQYNLINIMLNSPANKFSLKDLFEVELFQAIYKGVSERTARRDVDKLLKQALIIKIKDTDSYMINMKVLDFS
jgi:Fic family protein